MADKTNTVPEGGETAPSAEADAPPEEISLVAEFFLFLRENKKWWLLPIFLMLGLLALLVALQGSPAAPFIYTLF